MQALRAEGRKREVELIKLKRARSESDGKTREENSSGTKRQRSDREGSVASHEPLFLSTAEETPAAESEKEMEEDNGNDDELASDPAPSLHL
jgi:hypothetical protein